MHDAGSSHEADRANTTRRRVGRVTLWILGIAAACLVVITLIGPPVLKPMVEARLSDALQRKVSLESLRVNPFGPSVTVTGFVVQDRREGGKVFTFDRLYVNAGWKSLTALAPVVDEVRLVRPYLKVIRYPGRGYNVQDLLDRAVAALTNNGPTPRFSVSNLQVLNGRIELDDRATGDAHEIAELQLGLPYLSSMDADVGVAMVPVLSARVNGALVFMTGETLPFQESKPTTVNVNLNGFDLGRLVDYLPLELQARVESALLDTRLSVTFQQHVDARPTIKASGTVAVTQLNVKDLQGRPLVVCPQLLAEISEVDVLGRSMDFNRVAIAGPEVHLRRQPTGEVNLARVGRVAVKGDEFQRRARMETGKAAVAVKFGSFVVSGGRLRFTDETTDPVYEGQINDVQIEMKDFDNTREDRANPIRVRARTEAGETFNLDVAVTADPRAIEGRMEIEGLRLKRFQPYVNVASNLEVDDGRFDIGFDFQWGSDLEYKQQELSISKLGVMLEGFRARLRGEQDPLFRVAAVEIVGASGELGPRALDLGTVTASKAAISLRREKDGTLNLARIIRRSKHPASVSDAVSGVAKVPAHDTPWRVDLASFSLENASVSLQDLAKSKPIKLNIAPLQVKVQHLSTADGKRGSVEAQATLGGQGALSLSGPLSLNPLAGTVRIDARAIDATLAQPYIDERVGFTLTSAAVSAKGGLGFGLDDNGAMQVSYKGNVRVGKFASVAKADGSSLARWKALTADSINFNLDPFRLWLGEVAIRDFYGRIVFSSDRRFNVQDLVKPSAVGEKTKSTARKPDEPARDIRLDSVKLSGGTIDFSDDSVEPRFRAELREIEGSVTAKFPGKVAEFVLQAKGQRAAGMNIAGQANLFAPSAFLELRGTVKDVELPPLSAYAKKFVGYEIERGKLSLNVDYKIDNRRLEANNNIILTHLRLGGKVESEDAVDAPFPAAVAILKNRKGRVDIDVPIAGSLDDPEFDISDAVFQAFGRVITKVAAAPFAFFAAFVGSGEELSYIEFSAGSAALDEQDLAKLRELAVALKERPGVNIDIMGRVDPIADGAALEQSRRGILRKRVKEKDLRKLAEARAEAARAWLVDQAELPPGRVFLVAPKLTAEGIDDRGKAARVEFRVK